MKKASFAFWIFAFLMFFSFYISKAQTKNDVFLYFFHTSSCPHCKSEGEFLNKIENKYDNLKIIPVLIETKENRKIFEKIIKEYDLSGGVPTTIIGDQPIVGYNNEMGIGRTITKRIDECSEKKCESFLNEEFGLSQRIYQDSNQEQEVNGKDLNSHEDHKTIQVFGKEICLEESGSICFLGGLLGLADGINPCMFSVLSFLLIYLMGIGSSKKALKAGIAFIITTFVVYFLFMFGLIKIINILEISNQIRILIAIFAFVVGLVMIKDFFFYGKWFSFEISDKTKPLLEKLTKKGTVLSAIILAIVASIVELPCTSGIPLAYVSILSTNNLSSIGYLLIYNFFFVLPLIVLVLGVIFIWKKVEKVEEWKEKSKKYMRLVTGVLLIFLALVIWNNWF